MKKLILLTAVMAFLGISVHAQVDIDKSVNLTGTGVNAKIAGVDTVTGSKDAVNVKSVQRGALVYSAASNSGSTYLVTLSPAPDSYVAGMLVNFKANIANTGVTTVNVNGLGAKTIKKSVSGDLSVGDISANQMVSVIYDGTNFQLLAGSSGGKSSSCATCDGW
jgi:hypothetical protein